LGFKRPHGKNTRSCKQFLAEVQKTVAPLEQKEVEELRAFKAQTLKTPLDKTEITRWSEAYWSEKLRKSKYQIDQEKLRDYFPTLAAQKWLFAISSIFMVLILNLSKLKHGKMKLNITM
jgi:thimet oligopeptidase